MQRLRQWYSVQHMVGLPKRRVQRRANDLSGAKLHRWQNQRSRDWHGLRWYYELFALRDRGYLQQRRRLPELNLYWRTLYSTRKLLGRNDEWQRDRRRLWRLSLSEVRRR